MAGHSVDVYIYDVTKGLARSLSGMILGKQIDGVWHTGVVVYGQEFTFGGAGIMFNPPSGTLLGPPDTVHHAGTTEIPEEVFMTFLQELSVTTFRPECYNLFQWNCNTFSNEVVNFLTGHSIPSYIIDLPNEVLSSPAGGALRSMMESFMGTGGPEVGGQSMFSGGGPSNNNSSSNGSAGDRQATATAAATSNQAAAGAGSAHQQLSTAATALDKSLTASQATTSNHTDARSAVGSEVQEKITPPKQVVYKLCNKQIIDEYNNLRADIVKSLNSSANQITLLDEIIEYLTVIGSDKATSDWALGPPHIKILVDIQLDSTHSDAARLLAGNILLTTTTNGDIISLCVHDKSQGLARLLRAYDNMQPTLLCTVLKTLSNVLQLDKAVAWFLSLAAQDLSAVGGAKELLATPLCSSCLLHENKDTATVAANVTSRIASSKEFTSDMALDIGIALVEVCKGTIHDESELDVSEENKEQKQEVVTHLWYSLVVCCQKNDEVSSLVPTMSLDLQTATEKYPQISPYITELKRILQ